MNNHSFWQNWLFAVGLFLAVFGIALALFSQSPLFDFLFNAQINPVFWPDGRVTPEAVMFQQWIYGIFGATITGWGICVAFLSYYPFRNREGWAWSAIALGITVWFVIDTGLSLYFRVLFNAIFNTILFIVLWLPLAFTRRDFISGRGGRLKNE